MAILCSLNCPKCGSSFALSTDDIGDRDAVRCPVCSETIDIDDDGDDAED